jgi:hypothetical protein
VRTDRKAFNQYLRTAVPVVAFALFSATGVYSDEVESALSFQISANLRLPGSSRTKSEWFAPKIEFGCENFVQPGEKHLRAEDISGCIRGFERSSWPIRARLTGLRSGAAISIRVNRLGEFSLKNIPTGNYVLLFTQRDKVLAVQQVRLPLETGPLVVDVAVFPQGPQQQIEY